jgi:pantoate--beta-alanine ligase
MTTVLQSVEALRTWRGNLGPKQSLGFVPTMGALHRGHLSLMALSQSQSDVTIASIFVNPLQFGPNEDLAKYPRPIEKDLALLEEQGVDAVFMPGVSDLYAPGSSTYVVEETVSLPMCGAIRPGHYRGVATVVLKLLNLVQPSSAYFGQKDAQQCAVLERMVRDLNVPVRLVRGDIVREDDGLAMSSRNIYLSEDHRRIAPRIFESLETVRNAFAKGEHDALRLAALGRSVLEKEPAFEVQYWDVRHPSTLESLDTVGEDGALCAVAARLGETRLIDNLII